MLFFSFTEHCNRKEGKQHVSEGERAWCRRRPSPSVLASSSFPVLLLLSRLFPSVVEGGFRLDDFVPYVVRCASSPVWKVRELAARALVPLVAPTEKKAFLLQRLEALPSPDGAQERLTTHNAIHGTLLQVRKVK